MTAQKKKVYNYRFIATCVRGQQEVHVVLETRDITGTDEIWM